MATKIRLQADFKEFLKLLASNEVEYLLSVDTLSRTTAICDQLVTWICGSRSVLVTPCALPPH